MPRKLAGRGRVLIAFVVSAALVAGAAALVGHGGGAASHVLRSASPRGTEVDLDPAAVAQARRKAEAAAGGAGASHARVVVAVPPGQASIPDTPPATTGSAARRASDAEIERELSSFRRYLATIPPTTGKRAEVISTGEAAAPFDAPQVVIEVVQAANEIARTPYRWGGGHSAWRDKGYDCSGSVSFALAAAGLLGTPLDSTAFMSYGSSGRGHWITIYANHTHAFMTIAGLRFDTGGLGTGTRWQASMRPTGGFVARHPPGL